MSFELRHIRAFLVVAEELSFRQAAERLHIAQPALSRTIKQLEEYLGTELFVRTTRKVEITNAGKAFKQECKLILSSIDKATIATRSAGDGDIGHLAISYMDFAINGDLPNILKCFRKRFPGITVELIYMSTQDQIQAILENRVDFAFLIGPFQANNVETITITADNIVVLLPQKHNLASKTDLTMHDLAYEKFVMGSEKSWKAFRKIFFDVCHKAGFEPKIMQEATTGNAILGLVAAEMGISTYSECAKNIIMQGVIVKQLSGDIPKINTIAAWRTDNLSPCKEKFQQFLKEFISG